MRLGHRCGKTLALQCDASGTVILDFVVLPPAAVFIWIEGAALFTMVTGAFDFKRGKSEGS
jgi:hypothetical protein